jgi:hypothetical protein
MRMPRHTLKLIALAALISVAPALAGNATNSQVAAHHSDCPKKQAQARAGWAAQPQKAKGASIILSDRVPEGSLLDFGFRRGILTP